MAEQESTTRNGGFKATLGLIGSIVLIPVALVIAIVGLAAATTLLAGILFVLLLALAIIGAITLIVFFVKRRNRHENKPAQDSV